MNADDIKGVFDRSLAEGGVAAAAGPDGVAIARRVKGVRRRRTVAATVGGVAAAALVAVVVWQAGLVGPDPAPPIGPTETVEESEPSQTSEPSETGSGTAEPTTEPSATQTPTADPDAVAQDWSVPVLPVCGEVFALPDQRSQLQVTDDPAGAVSPTGGWVTTIANEGSGLIAGPSEGATAVVVDGAGRVVAAVEEFTGPQGEGAPVIAVASGQQVRLPVMLPPGCDGEPLAPGDYSTYVLVPVGGVDQAASGDLEFGQGGPFPLTVAEGGSEGNVDEATVPGAVPFEDVCGDPWTRPEPTTGLTVELLDQIRSPRPASDDVDGYLRIRAEPGLESVGLFDHVVLTRDGVRLSGLIAANDDVAWSFISPQGWLDLRFASDLTGCDGEPLPPGDYEATTLVLGYVGGTLQVLATSEAVPLTIE